MNANPIHRQNDKRDAVGAILLVLLIFIVLGRLCAAEFVQFDDPLTIANNPSFNPPQIAKIVQYWIKPEGSLYIPLTYSVWGTLAFIARVAQPDETGSFLNPWVFHTANLLLHCITTLFVWTILRAIIRHRAAAWIGAAIFAIHPVQVEIVAWASGTKDLLCGLFIFASILALIRYRDRPRVSTLVLGTLSVIAACLSKPTGIVAPAMALVIDTLILRTPARRSFATLWSWFVIAVVFAIVGMRVQTPVTGDVPPLWSRPLIAMDALAFYLMKLTWPAKLGIDYGRTPARLIQSGAIWWTWAAPLAVATLVIVTRRRVFVAAMLLILFGVAPVAGLVPFTFQSISTVADHYLYPSMFGFALVISAFARNPIAKRCRLEKEDTEQSLRKKGGQKPISRNRLLTPFFIAALSIRSFVAAGAWQNNSSLFANALAVNPQSAMSHTNWGVALAKHGDAEAALNHLRRSVAIDPDYAFGHLNLASLLQARGQYAQAAQEYRELLRVYRKQRNFDPQLGVNLQRVIDQLEQLVARPTTRPTSQPTSQEAR